jgi:WD40 repeat protein
MRADTLQVVWHSTDDKIQPIFSVDFHRDGTLATAGGDHDIRLWKVRRSFVPHPCLCWGLYARSWLFFGDRPV